MSNIPLCVCVCMFVCVCVYDHSVVSVTQSCLTLGDSMDCSPPGSSVHEISQARILEWVAIPFSRGSSQHRDQNLGLPQCRQILSHLSHRGSPYVTIYIVNIYMYISHLFYLFIYHYLVYLYILAAVNTSAMYIFFKYIPKSKIAGSCSSSIFNFFKEPP